MPAPFFDLETGFAYPSPRARPFHYSPSTSDLEGALEGLILSASGWRKVFVATGDEEDAQAEVSPVDLVLAMGMGAVFADFLEELKPKTPKRIALGLDARPTGPALGDALIRILLSQGLEVDYLGIVAAPEIMAWVQTSGIHAGFVYVSASHNPIGHNGVKLGLADGGVVGGAQAAELIRRFRSVATDVAAAQGWIRAVQGTSEKRVERVLKAMPACRTRSAQAYTSISDQILTLSNSAEVQQRRKSELKDLVQKRGLGIVGELNGSARGLSIDQPWLEALGVRTSMLNQRPRQFVHRIVPEGSSLDLCRRELEMAHLRDPSFQLGYVPDCDGDRGNVVFFDPMEGRARILEAQDVFALCVLSELAGLAYFKEEGSRMAVVANDPTSFRVDEIARAFGAQVFRAEVGEANVVNRARQLRQDGWTVRILGEGSNGGNITYPGSVRDPLSTLGSLIKLTCLRSVPGKKGLYELWCDRSGGSYDDHYQFADVLASLPVWTTTPTSEARAMLRIQTKSHALLKARFEAQWPAEWNRERAELQRQFGFVDWQEVNYEGQTERWGFGPEHRSGNHTGGLKIVFFDAKKQSAGCLWMRGSGTEPVFRIQAEVRGRQIEGERRLVSWLERMVQAADRS